MDSMKLLINRNLVVLPQYHIIICSDIESTESAERGQWGILPMDMYALRCDAVLAGCKLHG